jgi:hypothetical protein
VGCSLLRFGELLRVCYARSEDVDENRHVGRNSVPSHTGGYPPLASTKTPLPGNHQLLYRDDWAEPHVESQAMSLKDIKNVVGQFVRAAKNAIRAGFDGIELHGNSHPHPFPPISNACCLKSFSCKRIPLRHLHPRQHQRPHRSIRRLTGKQIAIHT